MSSEAIALPGVFDRSQPQIARKRAIELKMLKYAFYSALVLGAAIYLQAFGKEGGDTTGGDSGTTQEAGSACTSQMLSPRMLELICSRSENDPDPIEVRVTEEISDDYHIVPEEGDSVLVDSTTTVATRLAIGACTVTVTTVPDLRDSQGTIAC